MNVSRIYDDSMQYAGQIRLFTILVSGTVPVKSAADYAWGGTFSLGGQFSRTLGRPLGVFDLTQVQTGACGTVPSRNTLGGGGASAATGVKPIIFSMKSISFGLLFLAESCLFS